MYIIKHIFLSSCTISNNPPGKREVQPDTMADDFGGETVTAVQVGLFDHEKIIPDFGVSHKLEVNLTIPN